MAEPTPTDPRQPLLHWRPFLLAAALAVPAVFLPLVPPEHRPWGFAAFGAIGLFVAARGGRLGVPAGLALMLGAKLAFDLIQYAQKDYDARYLPSLSLYAGFALYAVAGWLVRRRAGQPLPMLVAAGVGSWLFFLWTNFFSWVGMSLPYDRGPLGLLESYWMAIPFHHGTLLSDLGFTTLLVAADAVLARVGQPAAVPVTAGEDVR